MSDTAMEGPTRQWIARVLLVALVYLIAGLAFGALAGNAVSHQMVVTWRLGAWLLSAIAFATHILFDLFRARFTPSATAFHAAIGAALGSLGLAAAATIHAHLSATAHRFPALLALITWPLLTGLPAFVVAFVVASVLVRARKNV
jgi:hypothetical protein